MNQLRAFSNSPVKMSSIIGMDVVNFKGDSLGDIKDVVIDSGTVRGLPYARGMRVARRKSMCDTEQTFCDAPAKFIKVWQWSPSSRNSIVSPKDEASGESHEEMQ
jgi:hypothetical protein